MAGKAGRRVGVRVAQPALAIHGQRAQMFKGHLQALLGGVRSPHGCGTEGGREAALFCCLLRLGEGLGVLLGSWGLPFSPNSPLNMGTATHPSVLSPPFLKVL